MLLCQAISRWLQLVVGSYVILVLRVGSFFQNPKTAYEFEETRTARTFLPRKLHERSSGRWWRHETCFASLDVREESNLSDAAFPKAKIDVHVFWNPLSIDITNQSINQSIIVLKKRQQRPTQHWVDCHKRLGVKINKQGVSRLRILIFPFSPHN